MSSHGKVIGTTTQGALAGSATGGALGILIAWVLIRTGLEHDPATAATLAGAAATILATIGATLGGKWSPTSEGGRWDQLPVTEVEPLPLSAQPEPQPGAASAPAVGHGPAPQPGTGDVTNTP